MKTSIIILFFAAIAALSSCTPSVSGCTDPQAYNHNANANVEDGTCTYRQNILAGNWQVTDYYSSTSCGTGVHNYASTIWASSDDNMQVRMGNMGGISPGFIININIDNQTPGSATVANQEITYMGNDYTVIGSGYIQNDNAMYINYTLSDGDGCVYTGTVDITR